MFHKFSNILKFSFGKTLPIILQSELAECGLACVAMIANYYGYKIDLLTLRRQFSVSLKGNTLQDLIQLSKYFRLATRSLKLELEEIKFLKTPCILHWDLNHFVVLKKVYGNKVIIHDPAIGIVKYKLTEISEHFTGIAMELIPELNFEKKYNKSELYLMDLWYSITGIKVFFINVLLISFALEIFGIISPFFIQLVTDDVLIAKDIALLYLLVVGFTILVIIQALTDYVRSWIVTFLINNLDLQLAMNLMSHLLKLPLEFFEKRHLGDIASRFGSLHIIQEKISIDFIICIVDGVMMTITLFIMMIYSPMLTIIMLIALIIYITLRIIFYPAMKYQMKETVIASAKEQSNFMETIRAILPLKIFNQEANRSNIWNNYYVDKLNATICYSKLNLLYKFFLKLIFGIEYIIIVFLGAKLIMDNQEFSVGMLIAYLAYHQQFVNKAQDVIEKVTLYQMVKIHLERLADIVFTIREQDNFKSSLFHNIKKVEGDIIVENLTFKYSEQDPYLFKNINFKIKKGSFFAIVGSSGRGKTTLMKILLYLLPRFSGNILVNNININKIPLQIYRSNVAAVMQDDMLLSGSIADNICFFDPKIDFNHVYSCAKIALIHDDIMKMPMSYNSLIGDMGSALSGGQKQRILIARALYARPKILFLDEATSHLDINTEKIINQNIKHMGITRIVISHRKEIKEFADDILDLEQSRD